MKRALIFLIQIVLIMPVVAGNQQEVSAKKVQGKEVPASRLPKKSIKYISANLPNAAIIKVIKQRRNPGAKFVVSVRIKSKNHTLVFDKSGDLVLLDGKKVYTKALRE
jgi:hypothetical protein